MLYTLAGELHTAVMAELEATPSGAPARAGVLHGSVVADDCCDGMEWVRWTSMFLTGSFPDADSRPVADCAMVLVTVYEVGVLRCVPTVKQVGPSAVRLPTAAELQASALEMAIDAAAILRAVCAVASTWGRDRRAVLGTVEPVETSGDCGGSQMTLTVELVGLPQPEE